MRSTQGLAAFARYYPQAAGLDAEIQVPTPSLSCDPFFAGDEELSRLQLQRRLPWLIAPPMRLHDARKRTAAVRSELGCPIGLVDLDRELTVFALLAAHALQQRGQRLFAFDPLSHRRDPPGSERIAARGA